MPERRIWIQHLLMALAWGGGVALLTIQVSSMQHVPWYLYAILVSAWGIAALGAASLFRSSRDPARRKNGEPPAE